MQVDYTRKLTWNKVGRQFFAKAKAYAQRAQEEKHAVEEEMIKETRTVEKRSFNKEIGRVVVVKELPSAKKWNEDVENEFFERMATKLTERDQKLKTLTTQIESESCTFKPKISTRRSSLDSDEEDEDDENNAVYQRFIRRVDEDIAERRVKNPERFATKRVYEINRFKT